MNESCGDMSKMFQFETREEYKDWLKCQPGEVKYKAKVYENWFGKKKLPAIVQIDIDDKHIGDKLVHDVFIYPPSDKKLMELLGQIIW
jgi:hypothetical protein